MSYIYTPCFQTFAGNVCRGIHVRMRLETTLEAEETRLAFSIGFFAVTALGAPSARVTRVNKNSREADTFCLINDKLSQLKEGPIAHLPTHFPIESRGSLFDSSQIFKSECLAGRKCRLHKLFTDNVIDVLAEPRGFQAHLLQGALRPLRAALLPSCRTSASQHDERGCFGA